MNCVSNVITKCSNGIVFVSSSRGRANANNVTTTTSGSAIVIDSENSVTVESNQLTDGNQNGITAMRSCCENTSVQNNVIDGSLVAGLTVTGPGASPQIKYNTISNGIASGITVESGGEGSFVENTVSGSGGSNIWVTGTSCCPRFKSGLLKDGHIGLRCSDAAGGMFDDLVVSNHMECGILLESKAAPVITKADVHNNMLGMIAREDGTTGRVVDSSFHDNAVSAVSFSTGAATQMLGCTIKHVGSHSCIVVENRGAGVVKDSEIFVSCKSAVEISTDGNPQIMSSRTATEEPAAENEQGAKGKELGGHESGWQ